MLFYRVMELAVGHEPARGTGLRHAGGAGHRACTVHMPPALGDDPGDARCSASRPREKPFALSTSNR